MPSPAIIFFNSLRVLPDASADYRTPIEFRRHYEFINQEAVPK
jgi:hypothetical protein